MKIISRILIVVLVLLSSPAQSFWLPWKKQPKWVHDHLVKRGVADKIATAALNGLSDQQLLEMSQLEVRILSKLLLSLQKTLDETATIAKYIPADSHLTQPQRDQLTKATLYLAASMRRSVDVVFEAMESKIKDKQLWSKALENTHHFVVKHICDPIKPLHKLCNEHRMYLAWHNEKEDL